MPYPQPPSPNRVNKVINDCCKLEHNKADCGLDGFLRSDKSQNLPIGRLLIETLQFRHGVVRDIQILLQQRT